MSSTSSPLGLGGPPGDIVDRIIDHLHCDTNTLITCALVARSWTPSAQFHIFSTIISHPDKPDRTMGEVAVWAKGRRVAQYVTTLVVQPFRMTTCPVIRTLELALPMMFIPNLRRVTLRNVYIRVHAGMAPPSQIRSASFRRPLTRLSIVSCRTQHNSFHPIGDLLCLFPAIDQLHFVNTVCSWDPPLESSSWFTFLLTGIRVRELYLQCEVDRMSHSGFKGFGHIIQRADPPWPLRTLRLSLPGMPQFPPLASFLNHSTKTLVDLRVDVIPSMLLPILDGVRPPTSEYWRTPILKKYISLRTMQLNFPTLLSNVPITDRAAVLAAFNGPRCQRRARALRPAAAADYHHHFLRRHMGCTNRPSRPRSIRLASSGRGRSASPTSPERHLYRTEDRRSGCGSANRPPSLARYTELVVSPYHRILRGQSKHVPWDCGPWASGSHFCGLGASCGDELK
ncbi:hypothetical protein K466DRAFT_336736 [Polyporus arcularius HHB13444]|uniref:F-box domain-containing protein n=1 Tax=Polyporus arcularius HHB13444 TaxID=1314778 RepID=A0A5C3NY69_9APHY|nr:hypothetical protein K466DRAFT_336736 [Polyporus arcularius HHB13444]